MKNSGQKKSEVQGDLTNLKQTTAMIIHGLSFCATENFGRA